MSERARETEDTTEIRTTLPQNYGDDMGKRQLKRAIECYQETVTENYHCLNVNLSSFRVEVSNKMKRTAGKVTFSKATWEVNCARYAYKAYKKWGWEKFAETIRHELIHVHTIQNYNIGGHGPRFRALVDDMDTTRHCESFTDANYGINCSECGQELGTRLQRSKVVKYPHRYDSKCCDAPLESEEL